MPASAAGSAGFEVWPPAEMGDAGTLHGACVDDEEALGWDDVFASLAAAHAAVQALAVRHEPPRGLRPQEFYIGELEEVFSPQCGDRVLEVHGDARATTARCVFGVLGVRYDQRLAAEGESGGGLGCEVLAAAAHGSDAKEAHYGVRWADLSDHFTGPSGGNGNDDGREVNLGEVGSEEPKPSSGLCGFGHPGALHNQGLRDGHAYEVLKGECENFFGELHEPGHFGYLGDFAGDGLRGKFSREADGCGGEREGGECSGAIEEALHALGHCKLGVDAQDYSEPRWLAALRVFNAQSCGKRLLGFDGLRCEHMGGVGEGQCENMCDECKQGVDAQDGSELHWLAAPRVVNAQSCGKKLPEFVGFRGEHMDGVGKGECESMCDEPHELGYLCYLNDLAGDGTLGRGASGVVGYKCETAGGERSGAAEEVFHAQEHGMQGVDAQGSELHWLGALHATNAQSCGKIDFCTEVTRGSEVQHGSEVLRLAGQVERGCWATMPRAEVCGSDFPLGSDGGDRRDGCAETGIGTEVEHGQGDVRPSRNARRRRKRRQQQLRNEADAAAVGEALNGAQATGNLGGVDECESGSLDALLQGLGVYADEAVSLLGEGRGGELASPAFLASTHECLRRIGEITALLGA